MVKNPPRNAGDEGFIPDRGTQIPHATGQLSPRVPTRESMGCNRRFHIIQQRSSMPQPISKEPNKGKQKMPPMPSPWLHAPMVWPLPPCLPFNPAALCPPHSNNLGSFSFSNTPISFLFSEPRHLLFPFMRMLDLQLGLSHLFGLYSNAPSSQGDQTSQS